MCKHQVFYLHGFCMFFLFLYSPHHYQCLLYMPPAINVLNKNSTYCPTYRVADLMYSATAVNATDPFRFMVYICMIFSTQFTWDDRLHERWVFLPPLVLDLVSHHSAAVWEETSDPLYCLTRKSSETLFPCEDTNTKFYSWMQTTVKKNVVSSIPSAQCLLSPQAHKSQSSWEFQQYSGRYESSALQRNIQWPSSIKVVYVHM